MKKTQLGIPSQIHDKVQTLISQGENIINFTAGDPDLALDQEISREIEDALQNGKTHYPPVAGFKNIREKISRKFSEDNNLNYSPDQIVISNGARESLFLIFHSLLKKDDEVIVPAPHWAGYSAQIKQVGGKVVEADTQKDNYIFTAENFAKKLTNKTKILVLNSPCNPTGAIIPREELEKIAKIAVENDIWVISDEVYEYYKYDNQKIISIASLNNAIYQKTITVNSGSKSFAMTGLRSGYLAGPKKIVQEILKPLQGIIASGANTLGQISLGAGLDKKIEISRDFLKIFTERRKVAIDTLENVLGETIYHPAGGFYLWLDIRDYLENGENSAKFCQRLLKEKKIAIVPGIAFGASGEGFVRIALTLDTEKIREGLTEFAEFLLLSSRTIEN